MISFDFSQPSSQSPKGLILIYLNESVKMFRALWPVFLWAVIDHINDQRSILLMIWILAALALLMVVHTILWFRSFKFQITDEQFILNKGYLNKKTVSVPLERIQNVETNQSVIQKQLGVMGLEIDTAGSDKKELKILSLTAAMAVELARTLSQRAKTEQATDGSQEATEKASTEKLLLRLSNRDLLKIGISQNHLRAGLLILAFGNQLFEQISDVFAEKAEEYSSQVLEFLGHSGWVIIALIVLIFIMASFLFSMIRTVLLFYDLNFFQTGSGYRMVSGLLNRKNILVPFNKIQQLNWETGPLKKLFGIYRVNIRQASGELSERKQSIELPGVLQPHLYILQEDLFGPDQLAQQPVVRIHRRFFLRNWLLLGLAPGLIVTSFVVMEWYYLLIGIPWIGLIGLMEWLRSRKTVFGINQHQIRSQGGAIATRWKQMEFHKVQQVKYSQSFFQRRRNLASLQINNASGFIRIPYVPAEWAKLLHDYLLYYAESSTKSWM